MLTESKEEHLFKKLKQDERTKDFWHKPEGSKDASPIQIHTVPFGFISVSQQRLLGRKILLCACIIGCLVSLHSICK